MTATLESLGSEFCRSLEKMAGPMLQAAVQRGLGGVGAGAGVGALAGAGIGTAMGYRQARQEGAGRGQALAQGLSRAGRGAVRGALVGGAGLGALQAGGVAPGLAGSLTRAPSLVGSAARMGQRQVHGLTGWTPKGFGSAEGLRQIGGGSATAEKALEKAWSSDSTKGLGGAAKQLQAARKA